MPPKVKFTKEEIVNAALQVARRKGAASVTTRDIAAQLGVSTRPIFTYFRSMDEVRAEMRRAAQALYNDYAAAGLREERPFPGFGLHHIRFAQEEPELYRLLFLASPADGRSGIAAAMQRSQTLLNAQLERIYRLDATAADRYLRDMWLVVHSLATLSATGICPYSSEEIEKILTGFHISLCKALKEIPGFAADSFDRDRLFTQLVAESSRAND